MIGKQTGFPYFVRNRKNHLEETLRMVFLVVAYLKISFDYLPGFGTTPSSNTICIPASLNT